MIFFWQYIGYRLYVSLIEKRERKKKCLFQLKLSCSCYYCHLHWQTWCKSQSLSRNQCSPPLNRKNLCPDCWRDWMKTFSKHNFVVASQRRATTRRWNRTARCRAARFAPCVASASTTRVSARAARVTPSMTVARASSGAAPSTAAL